MRIQGVIEILYRGWLIIYKKIQQASLRCITGSEIARVLQEIQVGECREHLGYYWPIVEIDSLFFA